MGGRDFEAFRPSCGSQVFVQEEGETMHGMPIPTPTLEKRLIQQMDTHGFLPIR